MSTEPTPTTVTADPMQGLAECLRSKAGLWKPFTSLYRKDQHDKLMAWADAVDRVRTAPSAASSEGADTSAQGARTQADAHLRALLRYTENFYSTAIEHGMRAGPTANAVAHVEKSARALHEIVHAWTAIAEGRPTPAPEGQGVAAQPAAQPAERAPWQHIDAATLAECENLANGMLAHNAAFFPADAHTLANVALHCFREVRHVRAALAAPIAQAAGPTYTILGWQVGYDTRIYDKPVAGSRPVYVRDDAALASQVQPAGVSERDFEQWLRTVCFQKPTPEAYDLALSTFRRFAAPGQAEPAKGGV